MIKDIKSGNILSDRNPADVIIGMNSELEDVLGIGRAYVEKIRTTNALSLGAVVSFEMRGDRELHMLICHKLGKGGWKNADQFVRYGMDYLWQKRPDRLYSIVNIGTGRVGKRDGADAVAIRSAIASSFLQADLYIYNEELEQEPAHNVVSLRPFRIWQMDGGEIPLQVAQAA